MIRERNRGLMSARVCPTVMALDSKPEAPSVTLGGHNIVQVTRLSILTAQRYFKS